MIDADFGGERTNLRCRIPSNLFSYSTLKGVGHNSSLLKLTFLQKVQYGKGNTTVEKCDKLYLMPGDQGQHHSNKSC